jgi:hypothetical protein
LLVPPSFLRFPLLPFFCIRSKERDALQKDVAGLRTKVHFIYIYIYFFIYVCIYI